MNKACLIFLVLFLANTFSSEVKPLPAYQHANPNSADTVIAKKYMMAGDSLYAGGSYDDAIINFDKASSIYESFEDWEKYIYCLSAKGRSLHQKGDYNSALKIFMDLKKEIPDKLGTDHILTVKNLGSIGGVYFRLGDYESAEKFGHEAVALAGKFEKSKNWKTIEIAASAYNTMGIIKFEQGQYDAAETYIDDAIDLQVKYADKLPEKLGVAYNSLAVVFTEKGFVDKAMYNYEKALQMFSKADLVDHWRAALTYINMAILLSENKGDYDEALAYMNRALPILRDQYGEVHVFLGTAYYNIGDFYFKKGNMDKAKLNFNRALETFKASLNMEEHSDIAMTYNSLGKVYETESDFDKAYQYYQNALSIRLIIFGKDHADVGKNYNDLGSLSRKQKRFAEAISYHEQALNTFKGIYGQWHAEIAECYNLLGLTYIERGEYIAALEHFQIALMANMPSFSDKNLSVNPDLEDIISGPVLFETLGHKADAYVLLFDEEEADTEYLLSAFKTYTDMVELIDIMRSGHRAQGSKFFLAERSSGMFEKAIALSMRLYELTGDDKYRNEAYVFSERSKARILQEAINESRAMNFTGIPDSLVAREKQLKLELTFCENKLQEERYRKDHTDTKKIEELETRYFSLKLEYQELGRELELNYPKYYTSKYSDKPVQIRDVQNSLADNEGLIEYFTADDKIYLFYFSSDTYDLLTIVETDRLEELRESFYSSIKKIDKAKYIDAASHLYELLLQPAEHLFNDKEKLTIIPDGNLYYLPFEALITGTGADSTDFSQLNYVVSKYNVTYHYSTSFLVNPVASQFKDNDVNGLIGFAPVFNNEPKAEVLLTKGMQSMLNDESEENLYRFMSDRNEIVELPYSEEELKYIIELFEKNDEPAVGYFYDLASKEILFSEAGKFRFIHLATHSFVNQEKPKFSGIILSQSDDSLSSDGTIYANEIYNLDLNAGLVVLSSCESGIGKVVKGEGMMALTRGFLYAGADNIITSLWKVLDKSTSDLMKKFYEYILQDISYSQALRKAKLDMISDKRTAFPVNWSGFVLIGK